MRLNYREVLPEAMKAMLTVEGTANTGLDDPPLLDLVKIRASQINGCAYCLALHVNEAREHGESNQRLDLVAVWREADCFAPPERAALAWCEALTLLPESGAPDAVYDDLSRHFTPRQIVALTLAIVAINGWNRLNVAFRTPVPDVNPTGGTESVCTRSRSTTNSRPSPEPGAQGRRRPGDAAAPPSAIGEASKSSGSRSRTA